MSKPTLPRFESDEAAEAFVASADLATFDLSEPRPVRCEIARKDARANTRLAAPLLDAVKERAARLGMPYRRFIRDALERDVANR
jgi:predicted DNA binding CopG/RHH family protein